MESIRIMNGRVWDGSRFRTGDVAIKDGRIAKIGDADGFEAAYTFDAAGKIVSAGLVDVHTHLYGISSDGFGASADLACAPFGVTAAAECGAEKGNRALLDLFRTKYVVFACAWIQDNHARFGNTERMLEAYGDRAVGVKVYFDQTNPAVRDLTPLREACRFASDRGLKVMVHCAHSPAAMADIVETLSPGDILTHVYHGHEHTALEDDFACLRRAKERGIVVDSGHAGEVHTDCDVLRAAAERRVWPDTISTDLTRTSVFKRGGVYGLTACMSLLRALGMPEEDVLRSVTSRAADALGQHDWGRLEEGGPADVAVLEEGALDYTLRNKDEAPIRVDRGYICQLTVAGGEIVYQRALGSERPGLFLY